jgi:hypothetical protein
MKMEFLLLIQPNSLNGTAYTSSHFQSIFFQYNLLQNFLTVVDLKWISCLFMAYVEVHSEHGEVEQMKLWKENKQTAGLGYENTLSFSVLETFLSLYL